MKYFLIFILLTSFTLTYADNRPLDAELHNMLIKVVDEIKPRFFRTHYNGIELENPYRVYPIVYKSYTGKVMIGNDEHGQFYEIIWDYFTKTDVIRQAVRLAIHGLDMCSLFYIFTDCFIVSTYSRLK